MRSRIIVDSCCDMTPEMKDRMNVVAVPLTMTVDGVEYRDDERLDLRDFMDKLKRFMGKAGSASPSPFLYQKAIEDSDNAYVVTLSGKLSGSHSNAVLGNDAASENGKGAACVFDSKSASAGETLIAIKIHDLIKSGMPQDGIIDTVHRFIDGMKTYFVLENYDNLRKNGRLSRVAGTLAHILDIKLIMGSDGNGEIALFDKCRGINKMTRRMINLIADSGKETENENIVISHCNNHGLADQLTSFIKERFHFKTVYVVPMGGLSSLYADDKGVILAF
ncbi:MAG: DegV family protein [Gracilibacteraceae bacterium]|nr:DegV family protein [Gracilibacteraceae bacterium]